MQVPGRRNFVTAGLVAVFCAFALPSHADIHGFNDFTLNGNNPSITGDTLQITTQAIDTDGNPQGYQEANSAFFNTRQSISAFDAHFTYRLGPVSANASQYSPADGFTFLLQNSASGVNSVGGPGGDMGANLDNSTALAFNIYGLHTVGTQLIHGGGNVSPLYDSQGDVRLDSGHDIDVDLVYKNHTLTETVSDAVDNTTFSMSYLTNIQSNVGNDPLAYVGFSGGTGGGTADQYISNFSFTSLAPVPEASTAVTFALLSVGLLTLLVRRRRQASAE